MRRYAWLKEPLKCDDGNHIYKVMLYEYEGTFIFSSIPVLMLFSVRQIDAMILWKNCLKIGMV